eukprot:8929988-Alexandrium_andersonii.AAC.1
MTAGDSGWRPGRKRGPPKSQSSPSRSPSTAAKEKALRGRTYVGGRQQVQPLAETSLEESAVE